MNSEHILCRKFFSFPFTVREHAEFWGCSNSFNGADVKAELEFIYSNLEQLGLAAHVHWRDKDRGTQKHHKLTVWWHMRKRHRTKEQNCYYDECLFLELQKVTLKELEAIC